MTIRPWPIIILAILHFIEPIVKIPFYMFIYHLRFSYIMEHIFQSWSWWRIIPFFILFPVAGWAIYSMRKWSYPLFFSIQALVLATDIHLYFKIANAGTPQVIEFMGTQLPLIYLFTLLTLTNLSVVAYFLIPAVRSPYFNPRVRWWESKPRYNITSSADITFNGEKFDGAIFNISEGGIFLIPSKEIAPGKEFDIQFTFFNLKFSYRAKTLHSLNNGGQKGIGIQFCSLTRKDIKKLQNLLRALDLLDIERRPEKISLLNNFVEWLTNLFKTGKGLVPKP